MLTQSTGDDAPMDLGLDRPEALEALTVSLDTIALIEERVFNVLPTNPGGLGQPGSDIAKLMKVLPDPPVDIRRTLLAAVSASQACLSQIRTIVIDDVKTSPEVLATLCRTALMSSSRILFVVGPQDEEVRLTNALRVMRQESDSLQRCYKTAKTFSKLVALVPPASVLKQQGRRHEHLKTLTPRPGESEILEETAKIVGDLLLAAGYDLGETQPALSEHLLWIFNMYSGVAHGFAWPRLVPGTNSLAGDFSADLWITACAAQLAVDRLEKAHLHRLN
jgi:hypothetical protein